MVAGDSISDAGGEEEEENEDESKRTTIPQTLRRNSLVDIISLSPPPSEDTWSLVSIKDNHEENKDDSSLLIFPPTHHENLHLSPPSPPYPPPFVSKHHGKSLTLSFLSPSSSSSEIVDGDGDEYDEDSSSSILFSPSNGPDSPPVRSPRKMVGVARWVNLGMEVVFSKVKRVLLLGSQYIPGKKSTFTGAAMVVGFLYFWWRRRIEQEGRHRAVRIIKEKDERINELLNQIARMNELFLTLQRLPAPSKS